VKWSIEQIDSPLGALVCVTREGALVALEFPENRDRLRRYLARRTKRARGTLHDEGVPSASVVGGSFTDGSFTGQSFTDGSFTGGSFTDGSSTSEPGASGEVGVRIRAYFAGDLDALDDIAVDLAGTDFERRVYAELRRVRRGTVITYSELARRADRPEAVRAVGATNAKNPISIVVPCHRVIGADGSLTGYAGGLERKRWLLAHEGVSVRARPRVAA
jgi:methylated-DNA-[protein]-cysteine S-methyltransferase